MSCDDGTSRGQSAPRAANYIPASVKYNRNSLGVSYKHYTDQRSDGAEYEVASSLVDKKVIATATECGSLGPRQRDAVTHGDDDLSLKETWKIVDDSCNYDYCHSCLRAAHASPLSLCTINENIHTVCFRINVTQFVVQLVTKTICRSTVRFALKHTAEILPTD